MNKVILVGHVARDSETRKVDDFYVTDFSLATDAGYFDKKKKEWIEGVDFHAVKMFADREVKKGDLICIEGSIKKDKWKDKDTGEDRSFTYVKASKLNILRKKNPITNHDVAVDPGEMLPGGDLPF